MGNVNDASTPSELMRAVYGELRRGTAAPRTLRRAKLRPLRQPNFAHPLLWAAFLPRETGLARPTHTQAAGHRPMTQPQAT